VGIADTLAKAAGRLAAGLGIMEVLSKPIDAVGIRRTVLR
jgi:hypothetical protein